MTVCKSQAELQLKWLSELAASCQHVSYRQDFLTSVYPALHRLVAHDKVACGIVSMRDSSIVEYFHVDFPRPLLESLGMDEGRPCPLFNLWKRGLQPILFDIPVSAALDDELRPDQATFRRLGLHNLATHEVTDLSHPVTGKSEVQFVSESQELQIGAKEHAPTRQSQGGDLKVLPELTAYVNGVGQRLAAVSERQLPYEFSVLNSSVPNAWALPGGKIAVNRGLLTELDNEAELAAVLAHEIVHAAARHGAKAQERGTLLQVGLVAAQIGVAMSDVGATAGNLMVQGAGLGAALASTRYSREAELESDDRAFGGRSALPQPHGCG